MISLSVLCFFVSIYLLYATAKRIEYHKGGLSVFFETHSMLSKSLGLVFTILGTLILIYLYGITNALLILFVVWPTIASFIILFTPFKKVKVIHLLCPGFILTLLEFVIQ